MNKLSDTIELESEVDAMVNAAVTHLSSSKEFLSQVSATFVDTLRKKFEEKTKTYTIRTKELRNKIDSQYRCMCKLAKSSEIYDKKSILIYGYPELEKENCMKAVLDLFAIKMGVNIDESQIDYCFRLREDVSIAPILVKFTSPCTKSIIFDGQSALKECGLKIREHIPEGTTRVIKSLIAKLKGKHAGVYTHDGVIYVDMNGNIVKVNSLKDVQNIA